MNQRNPPNLRPFLWVIRGALAAPLCLIASCAWTPETRYEEAAYQTLGVADMVTTMQGLRQGCVETNAITGPHPSDGKLAAYTVGRGLIHAGITELLTLDENNSVWWMRLWQSTGIWVEGKAVYTNIGIMNKGCGK